MFKLYSVVRNPARIRALWDFAVVVHRGNTEGQRSVVLYKSALHVFNLVKVFAISFLSASVLFVLTPIYSIIILKETTLLVNLFVPFVDPTNFRGYIITLCYQLLISSYGVFGNMAYDLFLAMIVSNYEGVVSIWECQLQDLVVINRMKKTQKNFAYRRAFLQNVYIQLLDAMK